jgi:DNA-binding NtrC family response regulator
MSTKPIVLVIEGATSEGESLSRVLDSQQYHTVFVDGPDGALAHLDSPVDLVLSGITLEAPHGRELLERWTSRRPATPYVLMIDSDGITAAEEAVELGATGYILSPLNGEEAMAQIGKWLERGHDYVGSERNGAAGIAADSRPNGDRFDAASDIKIPPGTTLEDLERVAVEQALVQHQGNRTHAAKELGISVRTLQRKLKAWGEARMAKPAAPAETRNPPNSSWNANPNAANPATPRQSAFRPRLATV